MCSVRGRQIGVSSLKWLETLVAMISVLLGMQILIP